MSHVNLIDRKDLNQSIDNFEFYSCAQGSEILNSENFTPDIIDFLNKENEIIQDVLNNHSTTYEALLEVGCGKARNIDLAALLGMKYFGIDFIETEVRAAQYKIKEKQLTGQVECISVLDLNHTTTPIPISMRTVCLFPFNVFGNIFEPISIMQIMRELDYSMLISTYRSDVKEETILNYYKACGLHPIQTMKLDHGILFASEEGFKSIIYYSEYIHTIANQLGLSMESFEFGKLGKMYYIR